MFDKKGIQIVNGNQIKGHNKQKNWLLTQY